MVDRFNLKFNFRLKPFIKLEYRKIQIMLNTMVLKMQIFGEKTLARKPDGINLKKKRIIVILAFVFHELICPFVRSFFYRSFVCSFVHPSFRLFVGSLVDSFFPAFFGSFVQPFARSLVRSLNRSFVHLFTHVDYRFNLTNPVFKIYIITRL